MPVDTPPPISIAQMRAARGLLGWSQDELAAKAGVGVSTVRDFEVGRRAPRKASMARLLLAFEGTGVVFLNDGTSQGVTAPNMQVAEPTQDDPPSAADLLTPEQQARVLELGLAADDPDQLNGDRRLV
jgi:transcriptional regulator with XRE-family HTH domain